jgi:cytochrome c oxidase assembly factor CtaG
VLALALFSPVDAVGGELFAVHMVQHELLMLIAAPLLVLGRPLLVAGCAFPRRFARAARRLSRQAEWMSRGLAAWTIHAVALWVWHAPVLFDAAVQSETVHALQHLSFLGAAMLFWHSLVRSGRQPRAAGLGVASLFTTALHTSALGALLTFAASPWYSPYAATTGTWGLSPLEDQQLGGLVMWVPGGLVYAVAGLALFARWLREPRQIQAVPHRTCALSS